MASIKEIVSKITSNNLDEILKGNTLNLGINRGYGSSLLLLGELYRYTDDNYYIEKLQEVLSEAISNESLLTLDPSLMYGNSGFLWVLLHLKNGKLIDIDIDFFLDKMDKMLYMYLESIEYSNYDYFNGYLGVLQYFLERNKTEECPEVLNLILDKLLNNAIEVEGLLSWTDYESTTFYNKYNGTSIKNRSNFGLAHGTPGILILLSNVYSTNKTKFKKIKEITVKSADYLLSQRNKSDEPSIFPSFDINKPDENVSRLSWCYGDLGILLMFLKLKKTYNLSKYDNIITELISTINNRTESHVVKDACLCHGSTGNWLMLLKMKSVIKNKNLDRAIEFQQSLFLEWWNSEHSEKYHGIKYGNEDYYQDHSFLQGTVGTLLSLISIDSQNFNWSKCINLF